MTSCRNIVLGVEYDGSSLKGWSQQPGERTIEKELLDAFAEIGFSGTQLTCAGRTDAGVHATGQVVSAFSPEYPERLDALRVAEALNSALPRDISAHWSRACHPQFNARSHARSRTYRYRIHASRTRSPLRRDYTWRISLPDHAFNELNSLADQVTGVHDFINFTPIQTGHIHFRRSVRSAVWTRSGDELVFTITADAFLRRMVRMLVGSMVDVVRGRHDVSWFAQMLAATSRLPDSPFSAPPQALCLVGVAYDRPFDQPPGPTNIEFHAAAAVR